MQLSTYLIIIIGLKLKERTKLTYLVTIEGFNIL